LKEDIMASLRSARLSLATLLRCTLVANGTKRHFAATQQTVAFGVKADIGHVARRYRF